VARLVTGSTALAVVGATVLLIFLGSLWFGLALVIRRRDRRQAGAGPRIGRAAVA
jgi:hypothetical protein